MAERSRLAWWGEVWAEMKYIMWFKPSGDPIRNLEKAGALIAAEIDRLYRRKLRGLGWAV